MARLWRLVALLALLACCGVHAFKEQDFKVGSGNAAEARLLNSSAARR
jgi:hypothetical protein